MITYARYDDSGQYTFFGNAGEDFNPLDQANVYVGFVDVATQYHDIALNVPVNKPPRPGEGYDFNYVSKQWEQNLGAKVALNRVERDQLLARTDWRVIKASESGVPVDPAWSAYRQALRDVPSQPDQFNIVWPQPPSS